MTYNNKTQPQLRPTSLNIGYVLAWTVFLLSLLVVYINFATGDLPRNNLYSSDALYLPSLYKDVFGGTDISGWKLTPAPYFFPDMVLYFLLNILTGNFHLAIVFFGVVQSIVFILSLLFLSNQLFGFDKITHTLLLLTGATFFFGFSTGNYYSNFWYIFVSAHHFSLVPSIIISLILVLRIIDETSKNKLIIQLLFLVVLSILMTTSDMLYVVQFVIPLACTLVFLTVLSIITIRRMFFVNGILISSVLLGVILNKALIKYENISLYTQVNLDSIEKGGINFWAWLHRFFVVHPILSFLEVGFIFVVTVTLIKFFKDLSTRKDKKKVFATITFFLFSLFISVTTIVVSNNFAGDPARYFSMFLMTPIFGGWIFLIVEFGKTKYLLRKHYDKLIFGYVFGILIFSATSFKDIFALPNLSNYSTPFVECITENTEKYDLENGIAHYRQAKYLNMLSKNNLNVVQTYPDLSPFYWINNLNWYNADFEFVVIDNDVPPLYRIDKTKIIERFGYPADTFRCANNEVLIYNRSDDILFQKQFQGTMVFASFDNPGDEFEFYGVNLPSLIGKPLGFSVGVDENWNNTSGYLTYGPYVILPEGKYYFEIHYFAEDGSMPIGSWDVVLGEDKKPLIINTGDITESGKNVISGTFKVSKKQRIQIRTFYNGTGALFVDKIFLKRITAISKNETVSTEKNTSVDAHVLQLINPKDGMLANQERVDFVWTWTGGPLPENQAFEVRVWQTGDAVHYGAHDASQSIKNIRQIGDTYILRLSPDGFYSTKLHGTGNYLWSVAIVEVKPNYRDLNIESQPYSLRIGRERN